MTGSVVAGRDLHIEHLNLLADDGPPHGDAATRPGSRRDVCPYPGIAAFDGERADFFHGRERDTEAVIRLISQATLGALIGSSGSGKSSLLAAGVLPRVTREALPGSSSWQVELLRPGSQPVEQLAARVARSTIDVSQAEAARLLRGRAGAFFELSTAMVSAHGAPVLWVIDQFEEVFDPGVETTDRACFLRALTQVDTENRTGEVRVLLGLRSDFYGHLDAEPAIAAAVAAHQHRLVPMGPQAIREAVTRPADQVGLRVEPALVAQILRDTEDRSNILPLLGFALQQTWRRRRNGWLTLAGYVESGGLSGALEQGAATVWGQLAPEHQETARRMLLRLVHVGTTGEPTRRRCRVRDLITDTDDEESVVTVIEQLTRARLLSLDRDVASVEPIVDLAHEAILREWSILRSWIATDRDRKRAAEDLADASAQWHTHDLDEAYLFQGIRLASVEALRERALLSVNEQEQEFVAASRRLDGRQRRRARLLVVLPVGLVLALIVAGFAVGQQRSAQEEKRVADALQLSALGRSLATDQRDLGLLLGLASIGLHDDRTTRANLVETLAAPNGPIAYLGTGDDTAIGASLAPDGSVVVGAVDGSIRVLSPTTGAETQPRLRGHANAITAITVSAGGVVVAGDDSGGVTLHKLGRSGPLEEFQADDMVTDVAYDSSRRIVVAATIAGSLRRWRLDASTVAMRPLDVGAVALAVELETGQLVVATHTGALRRWRPDGTEINMLAEDGTLVGNDRIGLVVGPTGYLTAVDGFSLRKWNLLDSREVHRPVELSGGSVVAIDPTTGETVVGNESGSIDSWIAGPTTTASVTVRRGLGSRVIGLATGRSDVVGLDDEGRLIAWDADTGRAAAAVPALPAGVAVLATAYVADGWLASGNSEGVVQLTRPGNETRTLARLASAVSGLAWMPPGALVAAAKDGSVRTVNPSNGQQHVLAPPGSTAAVAVAASTNGAVAAAWASGKVTVWRHGEAVTVQFGPSRVSALALSQNGRHLAVATERSSDIELALLDLAGGRTPATRQLNARPPTQHRLKIASLAFSADESILASGSDDKDIRLWEVTTGEDAGLLSGHTDMVSALALAPDGELLASGGEDGTVRLWDLPTHQQLGPALRADGVVWTLAGSRDGHALAVGSGNTFIIWPFAATGWQDRACQIANRDLSTSEWTRYAPGREPLQICQAGKSLL